MKKCLAVLMFAIASVSVNAGKKDPNFLNAIWHGADAKIELHILDDDEMPVDEAKVRAYLGMNFRPKGKWVEGTTDTNGVFVIKGKTCGDEIEVFVTKDGYYDSHVVYRYAKMGAEHEVKGGKWQPYGAEEKIVLRKILNPTRMVSNIESMAFDYSIIATNVLIGFDMEKNDLVSPHGKGEIADFYIEFQSDGLPPNASKYSKLTVSYSTPLGAAYEVPVSAQSDFKGRYSVERDKFDTAPLIFENRVTESGRRKDRLGQKKMAVVRSRCKVDEQGRLKAANYSTLDYLSFSTSFDGPGCCRIHFHFNPIPNDTNLEPKRERGR